MVSSKQCFFIRFSHDFSFSCSDSSVLAAAEATWGELAERAHSGAGVTNVPRQQLFKNDFHVVALQLGNGLSRFLRSLSLAACSLDRTSFLWETHSQLQDTGYTHGLERHSSFEIGDWLREGWIWASLPLSSSLAVSKWQPEMTAGLAPMSGGRDTARLCR